MHFESDYVLHLQPNLESPASKMRLSVALDSAKGILYLHTETYPPIFHCDIKPSNILVDSKLTAKVGDSEVSRLAPLRIHRC